MWKTAFKKSAYADHITSNLLKAVFRKFYWVMQIISFQIFFGGGLSSTNFTWFILEYFVPNKISPISINPF